MLMAYSLVIDCIKNVMIILVCIQTPILWSHGVADRTVLFEAGQAGPPFLEKAGLSCEFKVIPLNSPPFAGSYIIFEFGSHGIK